METVRNFTKEDSLSIKGVAICLMLMHHVFYSVDVFRGMPVDFFFLSTDTVITLSLCAKVCVPLFVFITAYGITAQIKSMNDSYTISVMTRKRYASLIMPFWFIFIIMQIICNLTGVRDYEEIYGTGKRSFIYFITDGMGLASCFDSPTLNPTWWYMSLAYLLVFLIPILFRIIKPNAYLAFLAAFFLFRAANWNNEYMNCVLIVFLGIAACEANTFEYIDKSLKGKKGMKVIAFVFSLAVLVVCILFQKMGGYQDIRFCLSVATIVFLYHQYFANIKILVVILNFFGKHSMNIFLTHTFIKEFFLHDFIYSFRYGLFIWTALIVTSLITSFIIEGLKKVLRFDKIMSKTLDMLS